MNKNDKWQNNITISTEQRNAIGDIAVAHLASGNADMFKLAMNSLTKVDTQAEIAAQFANINDRLNKLDQ